MDKLLRFIEENSSKSIAIFIDMDGVIASLDIDVNKSIINNIPKYFLHKRPIKKVISLLKDICNKKENVTPFILSACVFKEQACEKELWLKKYVDFIESENYIFVIKEVTKYNKDNKMDIKTNFIREKLKYYDLAIYIEDEYLMLQEAYKKFKDKILCVHISEFID